ncbi:MULTISPECIES: hypothetical protein [unclassified Microcystis]|nr:MULTISPECIES: hypothetical protein [unclassified Microcystis]
MQKPPEKWYFNQLSVISYQLSVISYRETPRLRDSETPRQEIGD